MKEGEGSKYSEKAVIGLLKGVLIDSKVLSEKEEVSLDKVFYTVSELIQLIEGGMRAERAEITRLSRALKISEEKNPLSFGHNFLDVRTNEVKTHKEKKLSKIEEYEDWKRNFHQTHPHGERYPVNGA